IPLPATKQPVDGLPRSVAGRHIPPRGTHPQPPPDPIDELPPAPLRRPALARSGQQRLQHRPLHVGQVEPPRHRYAGHEVSGLGFFLVDEPSTGDLAIYRSATHPQPETTSETLPS